MELETFFEKFDLLTDTPDGVQKLRKLILQLAVQGKLVTQEPNDEPAEVFLKRIEAEKKRLVKEGKIKKAEKLLSVKSNEFPHALPDKWMWVRLDEISDIGTGSTPLKSKPEYYDNGNIPWLTSAATSQDFIEEADFFITPQAASDYRLRIYNPGTLIIAL